MRGAQKDGIIRRHRLGIIPADAGSTSQSRVPLTPAKDHPRGCGEHFTMSWPAVASLGSSPRMRGAHGLTSPNQGARRIIPADAGSTPAAHEQVAGGEDHPRGCGEHTHGLLAESQRLGSSPRMRGAHLMAENDEKQARIIPADAGSTRSVSLIFWTHRDHPRGCGEHSNQKEPYG